MTHGETTQFLPNVEIERESIFLRSSELSVRGAPLKTMAQTHISCQLLCAVRSVVSYIEMNGIHTHRLSGVKGSADLNTPNTPDHFPPCTVTA